MNILRGFKLIRIFFIISVCLFSLSILPLNGFSDEWVKVGCNEKYTVYYNKSSVKIDKEEKTIEVWMKKIYNDKGKSDFRNGNINKQIYDKISYVLVLYLFNYIDLIYNINHITYYTKSDNVLFDHKYQLIWKKIIPDSVIYLLYKRIIKDYKLQK